MLARIQSLATGVTSKATSLATKSIYYSKVVGEVSKQVYLKEGLQPPSVADFQKVYTQLYKQALEFAFKPKQASFVFVQECPKERSSKIRCLRCSIGWLVLSG